MSIAADGSFDPAARVWDYVPTEQRVMGLCRTNPMRRPPPWPKLRAAAMGRYRFLAALFGEPRRRRHEPPYPLARDAHARRARA